MIRGQLDPRIAGALRGGGAGAADHRNRAPGVVQGGVAGGAQQQAGEPAASPAAHDEQLSAAGEVDQGPLQGGVRPSPGGP